MAAPINELLKLPFDVKIATKDFHPKDHISFASNHSPPNNKPFSSVITITNPLNSEETDSIRLWPKHCIQGTQGAELLPELDMTGLNHIIEKGMDKRTEMYSAFSDTFKKPTVFRSRLAGLLREAKATEVFVVGLAADYCVKHTAMDSVKEGFVTFVIENATKAVEPEKWPQVKDELKNQGVKIIDFDSDEIRRLKEQL